MKRMCCVYEAYIDDKLVAKGFAKDISMVIGGSATNIAYAGRYDSLVNGKYRIKIIGQKVKYYSRDGIYEGSSELLPYQAETFVERYFDLDRYGNTIMDQKEYKRHKKLIEDKGYNVKYTKIKHGRQRAYYLVEVI